MTISHSAYLRPFFRVRPSLSNFHSSHRRNQLLGDPLTLGSGKYHGGKGRKREAYHDHHKRHEQIWDREVRDREMKKQTSLISNNRIDPDPYEGLWKDNEIEKEFAANQRLAFEERIGERRRAEKAAEKAEAEAIEAKRPQIVQSMEEQIRSNKEEEEEYYRFAMEKQAAVDNREPVEDDDNYGLNWGPTVFPDPAPEPAPEAPGASEVEESDEDWVMVEEDPGVHSRYGDEYYAKYDGVSWP